MKIKFNCPICGKKNKKPTKLTRLVYTKFSPRLKKLIKNTNRLTNFFYKRKVSAFAYICSCSCEIKFSKNQEDNGTSSRVEYFVELYFKINEKMILSIYIFEKVSLFTISEYFSYNNDIMMGKILMELHNWENLYPITKQKLQALTLFY